MKFSSNLTPVKWNEVPKWVGTKVSQVISFTHSFRTRQLCAQCKRHLHAKHFTMESVALWLSHWPCKPLSVQVSPRLIRCYEYDLKSTPCIHMTIVAWDVKHKIIEALNNRSFTFNSHTPSKCTSFCTSFLSSS